MTRSLLTLTLVALTLILLAGCSSRDDAKLKAASTQIASLQTQLAQALLPTPTPAGGAEFCKRVDEWQTATSAAEKVWDASIAQDTFRSATAQTAISDAYRRAWAVTVMQPPGGNSDAIRLWELITASNAYSEQLLKGVAAYLAATADGSTASDRQKLDAQVRQEAYRIEVDSVSYTISKIQSAVCGTASTLRGREQ
jgi:hypothetical protein